MPLVTCFGEVLWDVFPTHKKIGGAPLNVALRLNSLGVDTNIISKIGEDHLGQELLKFVKNNGLDTTNIQIDKIFKTGIVQVQLNTMGSATYTINQPVAWDKIEITKNAMAAVNISDAFIFGSLACRDQISKNTLNHFLQHARFKVLDVNMRSPYYSMETLIELMQQSNFIKCNDEELDEICGYFDLISDSIEEKIKLISEKTQTDQICVTKGKNGAVMLYNNQFFNQIAFPIKVADTVGSGDSFLAGLIYKLLSLNKPVEALKYACALGALVASKKGANPSIKKGEPELLIKNSS